MKRCKVTKFGTSLGPVSSPPLSTETSEAAFSCSSRSIVAFSFLQSVQVKSFPGLPVTIPRRSWLLVNSKYGYRALDSTFCSAKIPQQPLRGRFRSEKSHSWNPHSWVRISEHCFQNLGGWELLELSGSGWKSILGTKMKGEAMYRPQRWLSFPTSTWQLGSLAQETWPAQR